MLFRPREHFGSFLAPTRSFSAGLQPRRPGVFLRFFRHLSPSPSLFFSTRRLNRAYHSLSVLATQRTIPHQSGVSIYLYLLSQENTKGASALIGFGTPSPWFEFRPLVKISSILVIHCCDLIARARQSTNIWNETRTHTHTHTKGRH